ncbi:MAG: hypothetical protein GF363_06770 [Chitinivibrionales bacterium]|nr:hypothetical protein [Chitinivibrionales bacterium]
MLKKPYIKRISFVLFGIALAYVISAVFVGMVRGRLRKVEPTYLLVDRRYDFVAELEKKGGDFGYWPLPDSLPDQIRLLTLAAEDKRFDSHPGIDPKSIARAVWCNYFERTSYSGASTLAMQCARLQNPAPRTWYNKISEAITAVILTVVNGKDKVLKHYLTIAPYGNRIRGINYAARRYFQKPIQDLSFAEAALLVSIPRAPGRFNMFTRDGFGKAKGRAVLVLKRAAEYGWIDTLTYENARHELTIMDRPKKEYRPPHALHAILAIKRHLARHPTRELDPFNPTVRLTLDLDMQEKIRRVVDAEMEKLDKFDADNCAVLVLDKKSGGVLSYIGNASYFDTINAGTIDFVHAPRSTGSLLKPFIYACGMEYNGYTAATVLTDVGLHFGGGRRPYVTRNYDNKYIGPVLYKTALANSRNIPAVQVLQDVGLHRVYDILCKLDIAEPGIDAFYYGLGLALGNLYASLYNLCQGYLSLANRGVKSSIGYFYPSRSRLVNTPAGADGGRIYARASNHYSGIPVFSPDIAEQIQHFLSNPQARLPSFPRNGFLEYPYPVAIKTGTSRGFRDAWAIGWSDTYMVGVWIGKHDNTPTNKLSGYGGAAPFAKAIFSELHPQRNDGLSDVEFAPPRSYEPHLISTLTGALAHEGFPYATYEYFKPGTAPTERVSPFRVLPIDIRNGLLATPLCRNDFVVYKRFMILPQLFKDWAIREGLPIAPARHSSLCGQWTQQVSHKISITNPAPDALLYIDPEMPGEYSSLILNCVVEPRSESVLWFVNGQEAAVSEFPYRHKWQLERGTHTFQAQVPYTQCRSPVITVTVL